MSGALRGPVLLVDDEPRVLSGLRRILDERWELLEATSADAALRILSTHPIPILMTDVVMPGIDGLQLLQQVEELSPDTVRILLTGRGDYKIAMRAVNEAHAFAFLQKPCPERELEATLDRAEAAYSKGLQRRQAEGRAERLESSLKDIARLVEQVGIGIAASSEPLPELPELDTLSRREWEVVRLLLQGQRVPRIARALSISAHTVRSHLRRVFQKLDVRSQEELIERLRGRG